MDNNPWEFGWGHLLTIVGFVMTAVIAWRGFNTLKRWRWEKMEERRIEVAIEALIVVYDSTPVFQYLRSPHSMHSEWAEMPMIAGESDADRDLRGPFWSKLKRLESQKDFFERLQKLEPKFMAMFGADSREIFGLAHRARREVEVAASMLGWDNPGRPISADMRHKLELRVWEGLDPDGVDEVGERLNQFRSQIEAIARPIVDTSTKRFLRSLKRRESRSPTLPN
ncbi:MAG: hypothetical protein ACWA6X_04255 [Bauldia sp.]